MASTSEPTSSVTIWSWNVNGLRAIAKKGFSKWIHRNSDAFAFGVQESRSHWEDLTKSQRNPHGLWSHVVSAEKRGYSGVGLFAHFPPDALETSIGASEFDSEGRVQIARWGNLVLANVYFPNGSGPNRDHSRVPYKLAFYQRLHAVLGEHTAAGRAVVLIGDFNTAHTDKDLARPKQNKKTSGFLPEERAEFDRWMATGWTDAWRSLNPETDDVFSWWSQRRNVRAKNIGWRIDYCLLNAVAAPFLEDAFIATDVTGSDHCPVGVQLGSGVLAGPSV